MPRTHAAAGRGKYLELGCLEGTKQNIMRKKTADGSGGAEKLKMPSGVPVRNRGQVFPTTTHRRFDNTRRCLQLVLV